MAHTLEHDKENGVIRVRHHGAVDKKDIWDSHGRLLRLLNDDDPARIFVDMKKSDLRISKFEGYEFSVSLAKLLPPEARVAVIKQQDGSHDGDLMFMKTVCANNGLEMKLFTDDLDAEHWLLAQRTH
ncbi:MAG: hypothetical protein QME74_03160 [Candidatus Edwardsbacteria bacterium]|nr:hypothetical protein [Candidatus Edwardsbacteria bacterium]